MPISLYDHFDEKIMADAKRLVRGRHVKDLTWSFENTIDARVEDEAGVTHSQHVFIQKESPAQPKGRVSGQCTCPLGTNCEHVAAVLLETMRPSRQKRTAPQRNTGAKTWLSRLRQVNKAFETVDGSMPRPLRSESREALFYLADVQDGRLRFDTFRGPVREDGAMAGGPLRRFDVLKHLGDGKPAPHFMTEVDLDILTRLATRHLIKGQYPINMDLPDLLRRTGGLDTRLVSDLCETGRFLFDPSHPLSWSEEVLNAEVGWTGPPEGDQRLSFFPSAAGEMRILRLEGQGFWLNMSSWTLGALRALPTPDFIRLVEASPTLAPEDRAEVEQIFHVRNWDRLASDRCGGDEDAARMPKSRRAHLRLFGVNARKGRYVDSTRHATLLPGLRLSFRYEGVSVRPFDQNDPVVIEDGKRTRVERDRDWEGACLNRLLQAGAVPVEETVEYILTGAHESQDLVFEWVSGAMREHMTAAFGPAVDFSFETLPALEADGWEVDMTYTWPIRSEEAAEARLFVETDRKQGTKFAGHGWFDLGFFVEIGERRFNLVPLITAFLDQIAADRSTEELLDPDRLRALLAERPVHVDRGNGTFSPVDLSPVADAVHLFLRNSVRDRSLHPAESRYAAEVAEALAGSPVTFSDNAGILPLGQALRELNLAPTPSPPRGVRADLRPYQAFGSSWMDRIISARFGGILADDMGLGKTLQVLTLLQARRERGVEDGPALLIVPTSLLHGWQEQAARFTPDLRLLTLHGSGRNRHYGRVEEADLVMTTYQLLSNDLPFLKRRNWPLVVVDEAQNLKNPDTKASRSLRQVPAAGRMALTGTPMENSLQDLWSLFDWLNPGLLGDRKTFRDLFRTPIEKHGDSEAQGRLNRRVAPFLLRRTKDEVASELPPRTEIVDEVILGEEQKALYESVRSTMDKEVRDAIARKGFASSQVTILSALLKLRQVCCDPALVKSEGARPVRRSAKRERLLELLTELIAQGRRVLVFSQFVEMLDLIRTDLTEAGIEHLILTGQTRKRGEVLDAFRDGTAPVFLISLKAGGVGLNLTEADTVILYDPWWNPAVERQAMDRAHRIGQEKPVFVHRLVAAGTVEDRILALQDRKQALADALLKEGGGDPMSKVLDEETLQDLFAPLTG